MNRAQRVRKQNTEPADISRLETASTTSNETTPLKRPKAFSDDSSTENSVGGEVGLEQAPPPPVDLPQPVGDIELVFRPLPADVHAPLDDSQIRYIKTTANATGKKYLFKSFIEHIENMGWMSKGKISIDWVTENTLFFV